MHSTIKDWLKDRIGVENLEFLIHSGNYLSASALQGILMAVTIPILTQLLRPDEYGILSVFVSLSTLFSVVFSLNLRSGVVRYYLENADDFDRALGANLLFVIIIGLIFLSIVLILSETLAALCVVETAVFRLAAITSIFWGILEIYLSYLRGSKQSRTYSVITVLRSAGILGGSVVLILYMSDEKYFGKIYAELFIKTAFALYAVVTMIRMAKFSTNWRYIKYTCRFSIPLIPHALSRYILGYFDRIIIQQLTTPRDTGLYSLAYDVGMAMDMVVMATVKAWQPIFFEAYRNQHYDRINRMIYGYSGYIYFAAAMIILFGSDFAQLIVPTSYFSGLHLVPILVLGHVFVFLYTLFFQYAAYTKRTALISFNTLMSGAANIALNYWLIPIFGYEAAAYTTTASFALLFLLHYINAKVVLKANTVSLFVLLPNFGLLLVLAALYLYATLTKMNPVPLWAGKITLASLFGYHFLVRVAKSKAD